MDSTTERDRLIETYEARTRWMAERMAGALLRNHDLKGKGDWREDASLRGLFLGLVGEVGELSKAVAGWLYTPPEAQTPETSLAVVLECVDVANYAMMIADLAHEMMKEAEARRGL